MQNGNYRAKPIILGKPLFVLQVEKELWNVRWWADVKDRGNSVIGDYDKVTEYMRHLNGEY